MTLKKNTHQIIFAFLAFASLNLYSFFCPECGYKNGDDAKFCANCGHELHIRKEDNELEKRIQEMRDKGVSEETIQAFSNNCPVLK